jgi:dolichol kinase
VSNGLPSVEESYPAELARKSIHLLSLSIPVIYARIPKDTALAILIPLTLIFAGTDFYRFRHPDLGALYHRFFGWLLRPHERDTDRRRFNGATYVLLSACICILLFPKLIVLTAFSILIVSDTMAALVGRPLGQRKFLDKSLEGATAFFLSALAVVAIAPKATVLPVEFLIGAIGAAVGTVVESLSFGVDDNLSIPLAIGVVMWILYALLLPGVNVFVLG